MTEFEVEARAALDAKGAAERQMAAAADVPPWRHAAVGLLMVALVGAPAVAMPSRLIVPALAFFLIMALVQSDKRRTGMFINGYRRGRTLGLTLGLVAVNMALMIASLRAGLAGRMDLVAVLALVSFALTWAGSVLWQRIFVREMGA